MIAQNDPGWFYPDLGSDVDEEVYALLFPADSWFPRTRSTTRGRVVQ
jgi:hypothetical protein